MDSNKIAIANEASENQAIAGDGIAPHTYNIGAVTKQSQGYFPIVDERPTAASNGKSNNEICEVVESNTTWNKAKGVLMMDKESESGSRTDIHGTLT